MSANSSEFVGPPFTLKMLGPDTLFIIGNEAAQIFQQPRCWGLQRSPPPDLLPTSSGFVWEAPANGSEGSARVPTDSEGACKNTCLCHQCCMISPISTPQSPAMPAVLQEMQNKGDEQTTPKAKVESVDEPLSENQL